MAAKNTGITKNNIIAIMQQIKEGKWFGKKHLKSLSSFSDWPTNNLEYWLSEYRNMVYMGFGQILIKDFKMDIVPILDLDPKRAFKLKQIYDKSTLSIPQQQIIKILIEFIALDHISLFISGEVGTRIFYPKPLKEFGPNLKRYSDNLDDYEGEDYFFQFALDNKMVTYKWSNQPNTPNKFSKYIKENALKNEDLPSQLIAEMIDLLDTNKRINFWPV